jgi:tetratricopeptide (TPR) repeat protein
MKILLFVILAFFSASLQGQDVSYLVKEGEKLEKEKKDDDALKKYQEALQLSPVDEMSLFKCSELSSIVGNRQTDKKLRSDYFNAAKTYAETALKQYPSSADANYAMALALEKMAMNSSGKEKLQKIGDIRKYLDSALKFNPDHARAVYLLGKWNMDVSALNVAEKTAVKTIFGGLPSASIPKAIDDFEKARKLDPNYLLNYLDLAKAYKKNGQSDKAIEILNRLIKLPPKTADDNGYKAEGKILLESLM